MEVGILSLLFLMTLLAIGMFVHISYLSKMHKSVADLSNRQISKDSLYEELSIPQGSNFSSVAVGAWMLFFEALIFLYFLTPAIFAGFNYFQVSAMASNPIGFLVFGLLIFSLTSPISANFPRIYSFYEIPKGIKAAIMLTFPLLGISLVCSAYIGTMYPLSTYSTELARMIAFTTLLISQMILLSPVYIGFIEVAR